MKLLLRSIALLPALVMATFATADAFDERVANVALLQAKPVQKELKISETQLKKMNTHADAFNAEAKKINEEYQKNASKGESAMKTAATKMQAAEQRLKSKVIKELSQVQIKRLREITVQQAGVLGLMDENVAKKVGINATQLNNMRNRFKSNAEKAQKIQQNALGPINSKYAAKKPKNEAEAKTMQEAYQKEMQAAAKKVEPQLAQLRKDFETYATGLLSATQKTAWNNLKGKAFKL